MTEPDFKSFSNEIIDAVAEGNDADCFTVQELAQKYKLLVAFTVNEPCGDNCECAYYTDDFPTECLRKNYTQPHKEKKNDYAERN